MGWRWECPPWACRTSSCPVGSSSKFCSLQTQASGERRDRRVRSPVASSVGWPWNSSKSGQVWECKWKWKLLSRVWLFAIPWTIQSMEFSRILEWVSFPFSRGSTQPRDQTQVSHIAGGFFTSWATRKAQEYWGGEPIPSPGDLPDPGMELGSPALQVECKGYWW